MGMYYGIKYLEKLYKRIGKDLNSHCIETNKAKETKSYAIADEI